ncbi:hypothetical protein HHX47_DHR7000734 [Lentinula edodes]|nr:hypothetical protein HHX47_DHR7000734 [Lentinula edodes]
MPRNNREGEEQENKATCYIPQMTSLSTLSAQLPNSGEVLLAIKPIVQAAGGECCLPHGRWLPAQPYELYFICTHYEEGEWRRVNGILEPGDYFVEGKEEAISKQLLSHEGISYGPFETCYATTFD